MSKIVDSIIGHAIGDAMGMPTEFYQRKNLLKNPITEMIGSEKTQQQAGSWTDDTSMEIATIDSFIQNNEFNYSDIMTKWCDWLNKGEYTPNGDCFDVGRTCLRACRNFTTGIEPVKCGLDSINSNGNGSMMRILPVALYSYYKKLSDEEMRKLSDDISSLTHRHDVSKLGCYMYNKFIINLLSGMTKEEAYKYMQKDDYSMYSKESILTYNRLLNSDISKRNINDISSSGYIVDTWKCVLWIILNAKSYKDVIIASTNIGNDTDTIGAIAGSMAGIIYGYESIPKLWLNKLVKKDYLMDLALKFDNLIVPKIKDPVLGSSIGDIIGSIYEVTNRKIEKNFSLFNKYDRFTDDTVMTFAVAKSFLNCNKDYKNLKKVSIETMTEIGRKYPKCGYGPSFLKWLLSEEHEPYGSYGNGAVMRISSIPMFSDNLEDIKKYCSIITNLSHNHEESIKGAESVCTVIYLIKNKKTKEDIKKYIEENYFKLNETVNSLTESKKKIIIKSLDTAKASIQCFLESYDYEDAIRNAISIGGDSDTIAAITGGMAASYYGIPNDIYTTGLLYLDDYLRNIYDEYLKQTNLKWE